MASKFHQYARLSVSKMGWHIFPLRPRDKRPLTVHGFKDASKNSEKIDRWWVANPKAGIGLPTGKQNGIIVIDFDPRNGEITRDADGTEYQRDAYQMAHDLFGRDGDLPETWVVETPGGGLHFYFKHPGDRLVPGLKGWKPGIDIKSDGGYVCAPPSIHPNGGEYIWAQTPDSGVPLAPLPETIEALLAEAQAKQVSREIQGNLGKGKIPSGNRNDALTSLAGSMRRRNMEPEAILAALLAENKAKCNPPLEDDEVWAIANSVGRYDPDEDASPTLSPSKNRAIEFASIAQMISEPPPVEWIIPGRLAKGDCALIVGPPGCGKSWITMDMAVSGALGMRILDEWPVASPLRVLYIDEENPQDEVNRRLHGIFNATVLNGARAKAALDLEARLHLMSPCQGFTFKDKGGWLDALVELVSKIEPDLIIGDSLTAISGIADENQATEVRAFFHEKLYPLRRICNSAILCVHHSNKKAYETVGNETSIKDGQIRGSIDYLAAVDACLFAAVTKKTSTNEIVTRTLHQAKQRRDKEPPAVTWDLTGTNDMEGKLCLRPVVVDRPAGASPARSVGSFMRGTSPKIVRPMFEGKSKRDVIKWAVSTTKTPRGANEQAEYPTLIEQIIRDTARREDIDVPYIRRVLADLER